MKETNAEQKQQIPLELRIPMPWGYLAACWYGDRNKRPLLAIHGWQDNAGTFTHLAPLIAPHRSVLAIDLPGNGRSSHLPPGIHYHMLDYLRVIHHVAAFYKWKRVSLLGHSMGGGLAYFYAALYPRKVDTVIAIDLMHPICFEPRLRIEILHILVEKVLLEDERLVLEQNAVVPRNPPMFEFAQLEQQLYEGSNQSVELEHCKYLLERNVRRSEREPTKFYYSCDRRIKYFFDQFTDSDLLQELAQRIRNINYLVIMAENSHYLSEHSDELTRIMQANNPNFERYDLPNTKHHMHLTQTELVAKYVLPFLLKHPSMDFEDDEDDVDEAHKVWERSRL